MNNLNAASPPTILPANGQHIQRYNGFTYAVDRNRFGSGTSLSTKLKAQCMPILILTSIA